MADRLKTLAVEAVPVLLALVAFLFVWEAMTSYGGVPRYVLPSPSDIASATLSSLPRLAGGLWLTTLEAISGFALGSLLGLLLACVFLLVPILRIVFLPLLIALNTVPSIAFVPLALLWFGMGAASKIAIAALAVSFAVLLSALEGFSRTDTAHVNLLRSFGAGRLALLWRLQLPAAMPSIATGLRIGLARSTIAVIVAEMLGAYQGIGQIVYRATAEMDAQTVWSAILVSSLTSLALYGLLVAADRRLIWWR
ncbi:ABC transporter permease [Rhizobium sp. YIM 134829]|uniref:ABC transporter permease n=1 Tax=Rhizobium sp. YIM 134829 TaxID=3390453 RepID=UPI0039791E40